MIGIYNYTVILTYVGMLIGFIGITCTLKGKIHVALTCLVLCGICDMFDGKIASTKQRTREEKLFGIQIDSLSDLVCFGVFPALIVYVFDTRGLSMFASAIYLLFALIRLAWFNVDESQRQDKEEGRRKHYLGLPVTTAAFIFPIVMNIHQGILAPYALIAMAIAFLTPFRVPKPTLSFKHE